MKDSFKNICVSSRQRHFRLQKYTYFINYFENVKFVFYGLKRYTMAVGNAFFILISSFPDVLMCFFLLRNRDNLAAVIGLI